MSAADLELVESELNETGGVGYAGWMEDQDDLHAPEESM